MNSGLVKKTVAVANEYKSSRAVCRDALNAGLVLGTLYDHGEYIAEV